jgi:hypothetical protein
MTSGLIISMALTKVLGLERLKVSIERLNVFFSKVLGLERLIVSLSSDEMQPCDKKDENTKLSRLLQKSDIFSLNGIPSSADRTVSKFTRARFISTRALCVDLQFEISSITVFNTTNVGAHIPRI